MSIFITAEIGINHNGSMEICKNLIDAAKKAGCDAVKFQKRNIEKVYTSDVLDSSRKSPWGNTQRDQKNGLEFNQSAYEEINDYCKEKQIEWYASAWDLDSQEFLKQFNLKRNKIASAMTIYTDLVKKIAEEKKHTFVSTGMTTYAEIQKIIDIFKINQCPFELMHTVSTYPMKSKHANLNLINTLREKFNCDVGYSGHEVSLAISFAAVAFGITSLERHITLDRSMYGSDQSASIEPHGFAKLVETVRELETALGSGDKVILPEEEEIAKKLRNHIL
tara:strand:+ start:969 stop:1802 length:834 start_codon:yes stop_codon:yes gene_type:complete